MKRRQLLRHLRERHCVADEKGRETTLYRNERTGATATVSNRADPDDMTIRMVCKRLEIDVPRSLSGRPKDVRGGAPARTRNRRA
jgi:hypothetical protein